MGKISTNYTGVLLISIFAVILISGCTGVNKEGVREELKFEVMYTGNYAPFPDKKFIAVQNEKDFMDLLTKAGINLQSPDFEKYTVIALFMGEQKTGGYSITLDRVVRTDGLVKIYVKNLIPSETCIVTQQITRPFQIVKVEKIAEKIEFVESTQEVKC